MTDDERLTKENAILTDLITVSMDYGDIAHKQFLKAVKTKMKKLWTNNNAIASNAIFQRLYLNVYGSAITTPPNFGV